MDPQKADSASKDALQSVREKSPLARWVYSVKQLGLKARKKLEFTRGLQFTITAQIISAIALSFSIGNLFLYRTASERLLDNSYNRYNDHVDIIVNSMDRWVDTTKKTMQILSESPSIKSLDPQKINQALTPYFKLKPYRVWRVFDNKGKLLLSSKQSELNTHEKRIIELRLKLKQGYLKALQGEAGLDINFMRKKTSVEGCLVANQPIFPNTAEGIDINGTTPIGVLRFCLPLSKLADDNGISDLTQFSIKNNRNNPDQPLTKLIKVQNELEIHRGDYSGQIFYIVTKKGNLIFPSANDSRFDHITLLPPKKVSSSSWGRLTESILSQHAPGKFKKISFEGENFYAISKQASQGFSAIVIVDENTVFKPLNGILFKLLVIQLIVLLVVIIVCYFACRQLTKPLQSVINQVRNLGDLDLSANTDKPLPRYWILEINQVTESIVRLSRAMDSFTRYLPIEVVRNLLMTNRRAVLGGSNKDVAIMFTDIADFTMYSESLPANELLLYLNDYFSELTECVQATSGTIDKYIGDSLMVLWGAPIKLDTPCQLACSSALAIRSASANLVNKWTIDGVNTVFKTRIGIHYGNAIVGNVGSKNRFNYTIIGDSVNVANRLEGINKNFGSEIIVSESVLEQLGKEQKLADFCFRLLDVIQIKGKNRTTKVYELVDHSLSIDPDLKAQVDIWNRIMNIAIEQGPLQALKQWGMESAALRAEPFMLKLRKAIFMEAQIQINN